MGTGAGVLLLLYLTNVDDAQFQRERPLVSQDLGEGTTEPPKPVVADLSGVAQTGFFRMEECSLGRLRLVSLQAR